MPGSDPLSRYSHVCCRSTAGRWLNSHPAGCRDFIQRRRLQPAQGMSLQGGHRALHQAGSFFACCCKSRWDWQQSVNLGRACGPIISMGATPVVHSPGTDFGQRRIWVAVARLSAALTRGKRVPLIRKIVRAVRSTISRMPCGGRHDHHVVFRRCAGASRSGFCPADCRDVRWRRWKVVAGW